MAASAILLLESDAALAGRIQAILTAVGHEIVTIDDPAQLSERAANCQLLLLDLPDSGSAEGACRSLRDDPALAPIPLLCFTASADVEERVRLLEAGADDVVSKPFDDRELEARVEALLLRFQRSRGHAPAPSDQPPVRAHQLAAFFSPKGGVGTTTLAVNTAVALAERQPGKVALVDLAIPIGQVSTHLDFAPRHSVAELVRDDTALADASLLRAAAETYQRQLDVFALPLDPHQAEAIDADQVGHLLDSLRSTYLFVIADGGSALGPRSLALLQAADRVIVPTSAEISSLKAVGALLGQLAEHALADRAVIVLNHVFAREMVRSRDIEETLGARIAIEVPYDAVSYVKAVNEGVPVVRGAPRTSAAEQINVLASIVSGETAPAAAPVPARRGLLGGLLKRT